MVKFANTGTGHPKLFACNDLKVATIRHVHISDRPDFTRNKNSMLNFNEYKN